MAPPFTDAMFDSKDGMLTSVWGPALWHVLHTISFNYPVAPSKEQQRQYRHFVHSLGRVLPCVHCRTNFQQNLRDCRFGSRCFKDRRHFSRFIFRLHNQVNRMLGKPTDGSFKRVRERYEHFRSRCVEDPAKELLKESRGAREGGCVEPLYGSKAKCLLRIVPKDSHHRTFAIDRSCRLRRSAG